MFAFRRLVVPGLVLLALSPPSAFAREAGRTEQIPHVIEAMPMEEAAALMPTGRPLNARAALDTTLLGYWDFEQNGTCYDDGWVPYDLTEPLMDAWHIDDFVGLGGGTFGRLGAPQGNQALWMGARPAGLENLDICHYATLPGYGNAWWQTWCTKTCLSVTRGVTVVFVGKWDSEPGYDGTTLQVATCTGAVSDENWLATRPPFSRGGHWDGINGGINMSGTAGPDSLVVESIPDSMHTDQIQIRFLFTADGRWSDEDGLWDTDGAMIIDSLSMIDDNGTVLSVELFEDELVGATSSDDWESCNEPGFGAGNTAGSYPDLYADLFSAPSLLSEDRCQTVLGCVWAFIAGSEHNYACGGFPNQISVPRGPSARNQYIRESIYSPVVPLSTTSMDVKLDVRLYADLHRDYLVYLEFQVRSFVDGCPTNWRDHNGVYRSNSKTWEWFTFDVGVFIAPGATEIQVRTGVRDMCPVWCDVLSTLQCHSHAPLIDQVRLYAVEHVGPLISPSRGAYFNDNFSEDGTLTGTVRVDPAVDIRASGNPVIDTGDSMAVTVTDPMSGLSTGAFGGDSWASVYAYVGVWPQGKYSGDQITDDPFRWPVVDSTTSPAGDRWYVVRLDTAFSAVGRSDPADDRFCLDLNDNLFVPGDTICYFIAAQSAGTGSWAYYHDRLRATDASTKMLSTELGITNDIGVAYTNPMEMTCLPTQHLTPGKGILYVDAADGRGVQPFFDTAFDMLGIRDRVDRFDVSESGSSALGQFAPRV
ncbi:MAG: hypothetical protein IH969_07750, partial [Candidatus Krumholzibacteriota bacterium]|nr:hypothetical protein [Candidatus Krumholzibacteriota bacterium]